MAMGSGRVRQRTGFGTHYSGKTRKPKDFSSNTRLTPTSRSSRKRRHSKKVLAAAKTELIALYKNGLPCITLADLASRDVFVKALLKKKKVKSITSPYTILRVLSALEHNGDIPTMEKLRAMLLEKKKKKKPKKKKAK